ncbi:MAG: hypothetical protein KKI09_04660 [Spirochaetes bacterium]|nr:hypothetical protein [Spirochaetota bacterium]
MSPAAFFSGNYKLKTGSSEYLLSAPGFYNPESNYEGLLYAFFEFQNDGSKYTQISYQWKFIEEESLRNTAATGINLMVSEAHSEFADVYPVYVFDIDSANSGAVLNISASNI